MSHAVNASVDANVSSVEVAVGAAVAAGDVLAVLESMKLEVPVTAPVAGTVREVGVQPGAQVAQGQALFVIDEA